MPTHDQVLEDFQALKPHLFTSLVRLDICEQYSFDIFEQEALLQLWFCADDVQEASKPFLHLSCYSLERRKDFFLLGHPTFFQLRMKVIRRYPCPDYCMDMGNQMEKVLRDCYPADI